MQYQSDTHPQPTHHDVAFVEGGCTYGGKLPHKGRCLSHYAVINMGPRLATDTVALANAKSNLKHVAIMSAMQALTCGHISKL